MDERNKVGPRFQGKENKGKLKNRLQILLTSNKMKTGWVFYNED